MATKNQHLRNAEEVQAIKKLLCDMMASPNYRTEPTYSADETRYPGGLIPFDDKHIKYLRAHPSTDPLQYVSNLRLMTRIS